MKLYFLLMFALALVSSCGLDLPKPHDVKFKDDEFNSLAIDILDQTGIESMDDFTRDYKELNGIPIRLTNKEAGQYTRYLPDIEKSLHLDPKLVSNFRNRLEQTKLRDFTKRNDTILFITDGFLNDSWGFLYSAQALRMDSNWFSFKSYNVKYVENINKNWKRVAIH